MGGVALEFAGEVLLDGIDEDEFFAAAAFVIEPAPFELALVAEVVDFLDAAGDEVGGLGDADPGGGALHAEADFAVDRRGDHLEEPLLREDGRWGAGDLPVACWLAGEVHLVREIKAAGGDDSFWDRWVSQPSWAGMPR